MHRALTDILSVVTLVLMLSVTAGAVENTVPEGLLYSMALP